MTLEELFVHEVTVEPQTSTGPYGDQYGPAQVVRGFLDESRRLVRDKTGAEVVSEATFYTRLDAGPLFPLDSRVTLPSGQVAYVLKAARRDGGRLPVPSHLEVTL